MADRRTLGDHPEIRTLLANIRATERMINLAGGTPWFDRRTQATGAEKEFDVECKYPDDSELDAKYYRNAYERWGIAARVVNIWPDECWAAPPEILENEDAEPTEWEKAVQSVVDDTLLMHYAHRADRMSRVGRFGILYLGLDDGGALDNAPSGVNPRTGEATVGRPGKRKLMFLRAFDEATCKVTKMDLDPFSPRHGLPTEYAVMFGAADYATGQQGTGISSKGELPGKETKVHWTRVIHLAEGRSTSEVFAVPCLKGVINYIHDIRKVAGSSAEMFYKGGFPGYAFEERPDTLGIGDTEFDVESLRETLRLYQAGLERFLYSVNGSWKSLQPQVADPSPHVECYGKLICTTIDVPMRIFFGTESGHLASTQDDGAWRTRLKGRQVKYVEPMVLRPLIDRLMLLRVLPETVEKTYSGKPKYIIEWQDLRTLSDSDRAEIALKRIQSLMQYQSGDVQQLIGKKLMYTLIAGFTDEQAKAIIKDLEENPPPKPMAEQKMEFDAKQAEADRAAGVATAKMGFDAKASAAKDKSSGGGRKGNPTAPGKKVGKPKGTKPEGTN